MKLKLEYCIRICNLIILDFEFGKKTKTSQIAVVHNRIDVLYAA